MDLIQVRNVSKGPLAIMETWKPGVERTLLVSRWKRSDAGLSRAVSTKRVSLPTSITLMPGESAIFPQSAASSEQIAGLHRAGLIKVAPAPAEESPKPKPVAVVAAPEPEKPEEPAEEPKPEPIEDKKPLPKGTRRGAR